MNEKTTIQHWDSTWESVSKSASFRHGTPLNVAIADRRHLIAAEITQGCRYIEVGCAPGILLAYAQKLGAIVSGLDYSAVGIEQTRRRFVDHPIPLYCEDILDNSVPKNYFDVVHSAGLIEHFDHPEPIVRAHIDLARPGGVILITVPHFGGIYGRINKYTDPELLAIHNLKIMSPGALTALVHREFSEKVSAFPYGRISLSSVSFRMKQFGLIAKAVANVVGLLQFWTVNSLAPTLVLRIIKSVQCLDANVQGIDHRRGS